MNQLLNPLRQCLYEPNWQALRVSLKGKWATDADTDEALDVLDDYVAELTRERRYRVINLLNAILMGLGASKPQDSTQYRINTIRCFRERVKLTPVTGDLHVPTVLEVQSQWATLDGKMRRKVLKDLHDRQQRAPVLTKPELEWFLGIVRGKEYGRRYPRPGAYDG